MTHQKLLEQGKKNLDLAERNMAVNNNLQRAQEVIRGLNQALDLQNGGELAMTLNRLYDYFDRRIHESNMTKQPEAMDEVVGHLSELRDAWHTMLHSQDPAAPIGQHGP